MADPDALVCPSETGGHVDLNNWRRRVWIPATQRAGVRATPYDGRHTYASLLIHEGRSRLLVAAAMGHSTGETVWRHSAHVFEAARLGVGIPMVEAVRAAREELAASGVYRCVPGCGCAWCPRGPLDPGSARGAGINKHARQDSNLRPLAPEGNQEGAVGEDG